MQIYEKKLSSCVSFHANRDKRFKSASISFHYFMPYIPQLSSAFCLLPAVLKRGCKSHPTLADIARKLETLFGSDILHFVRKRGSLLEITFRLEAIDDAYILNHPPIWEEAIHLLKDIIYRPLLLEADFSDVILEQEKNSLMDSIQDIYNNKDAYALMRAAESLYPETVYAARLKGTPEMVAAVSKADLVRAYEHLIQHSSLHIYYSGSKTNQEMLTYLYDVPSYHSGEAPLLHPYIDTPVNSQPIYLSEVAEDAEQSHVVVSYRIPIAKYTGMKASVFSVHNSILGYSPTSKLYQEVREKSGLCYSCTLITNNLYGVFMVEAGVQPGREQEAVDRIREQFDAMKKGDFSEKAFHIALESISTAFRSLSTSPTQLENHYFAAMLSGNTYRPGLIRAASKQVTHDDVRDAAALLEYVGAFILTGGEHDN